MNSKRKLLLAMGSGLVSSGFAQSPASVPPKEKGPLVWLDMDQAELDASYDQSIYGSHYLRTRKARWEALHQRAAHFGL